MTSDTIKRQKDDVLYHDNGDRDGYAYVCNECLAIYFSNEDVENHAREAGHNNNKDVTSLKVVSIDRISDNRVLVLFDPPEDSSSWSFAQNNKFIGKESLA